MRQLVGDDQPGKTMIYRRNISPNFNHKDEKGFASFHDAAEVSGTLLVMKLVEDLSRK